MNRYVIGVDPGSVSAAFAVLDREANQPLVVADVAVTDKMVDAAGFRAQLFDALGGIEDQAEAVVERVGSFPKQGLASAFNFGLGTGLIRGVLGALQVPTRLVAPAKWKRDMRLDRDGETSRALAIRLFPAAAHDLRRKKDHGRAEALLLAFWSVGGRP
jgi:hypothetical protein